MESFEKGWVRGAVVIGIAGTMMAVALLSPALGASFATKSWTKQRINSKVGAATTNLQSQINAGDAAGRVQTFVRSAPVLVSNGGTVAGDVACPSGMVATGGGVVANNANMVVGASAPTDGTGNFSTFYGFSGIGMTGWGAIVSDPFFFGGGMFRVYASCRTGTVSTSSNYTSGGPAVRSTDGASTFSNLRG
jgi:hypothetical protein